MAATQTARDVAKRVSKTLGREVNAKRVRAWVRDHIDAYDDDGYTPHQYDARTADRIVAGMTKSAKTGRAVAASAGRSPKPKTASKPATTTDEPAS